MLTRFFWTNTQDKGIPWRRKEILHQPKGFGGLCIRTIAALNKALLMKQAWRINHHPQLLISRVYARCTFAQLLRSSTPRNLSWGSRGLLHASRSFLSSCVLKVGNGCSINASSDKWVCGRTPVMNDRVPLREAALLKVADFIHSPSNRWDFLKLQRLFTPASAREISEIELPSIGVTADRRIWSLTQSGHYSTKTGYVIALQHQQLDICSMTDDQLRFVKSSGIWTSCQSGNFSYGKYGKTAWPLLTICFDDASNSMRIVAFVSTTKKIMITSMAMPPSTGSVGVGPRVRSWSIPPSALQGVAAQPVSWDDFHRGSEWNDAS